MKTNNYLMFEEIDRISETFTNARIFITGGSGFMGKIFIEKILRVTKVEKIFLLLRGKKSKNPKQRLMEIFDDCVSEKKVKIIFGINFKKIKKFQN